MKTKKSPPAYVWWHRNRLARRMITPFDSGDTLGPKQFSQSHRRHQKASKNFFRAFQSQTCHFLKSTFGCSTCDFWWKSLKNKKNWLPINVCARENLLRRRMITPSTLLDSLWYKQHFTNLSCDRTMRQVLGNGTFLWNLIFKILPKWQFFL